MDQAAAEMLADAGRRRKRGETVESAVGAAVRRKGADFSEYVRVMSVLREEAAAKKVPVDRFLQDLSSEQE